MLKSIGFTKSVGRQWRIDSSKNCSELDKEDSRDTLNIGISSISDQVEEELQNK
jgi:hypothetical protein